MLNSCAFTKSARLALSINQRTPKVTQGYERERKSLPSGNILLRSGRGVAVHGNIFVFSGKSEILWLRW